MFLRRAACLAALAAAVTTTFATDDAQACGGCFVGDQENTVVTGHRMALSVSTHQTVLWDQIEYDGDPEEFSWVLPVKPGATLEVASPAFFEVLEAGTATVIGEPPRPWCESDYGDGYYDGDYDSGSSSSDSGFGCGSGDFAADAAGGYEGGSGGGVGGMVDTDGEPPPDVQVVSQGTVGPYETVTLSTEVPGALNGWLDEHGYNVPADIQPVIDAYVAEGFDFIALRLIPGEQVSAMQPVRVTTPGSSFNLPLRMVAAGTGAKTQLTLYVIGEGRYEAANFPSHVIDKSEVVWDFDTSSSNYAELRATHYAMKRGATWVTSYARRGSLFEPVEDGIQPVFDVSYQVGTSSASTLAQAYVLQGTSNGQDPGPFDCLETMAAMGDVYVKPACETPEDCEPLGSDEIEASELVCGELDDVAVAVTGLHTKDVWITRLDAAMPREALGQDLILEAADDQKLVDNRYRPTSFANACPQSAEVSGASLVAPRQSSGRGGLVPLTLAGLGLVWWMRRRRSSYDAL